MNDKITKITKKVSGLKDLANKGKMRALESMKRGGRIGSGKSHISGKSYKHD